MQEPRVAASFALPRPLAALAAAIGVVVCSPAAAHAKPAPPPEPAASAWIVVDESDGDVLAAHDEDAELSIASATKLMTTYLLLSELAPRDPVVGVPYSANPFESLLGLQAGEVVSARDLAYALILASANDGAVAAATAIDGSVDEFVARMNGTAAALGLDETSYANPIGFDDPANHSSASDLAALTRVLFDNDLFRRIADTESHVVATDQREIPIKSRNSLLLRVPWVDGVKTGYTGEAGNVLVASGTREGQTVISVVLGSPDEASRDADSLALLRHGFDVLKASEPAEAEVIEPAEEESEAEEEPSPAAVPVDSLADDGTSPLVTIALSATAVILIAAVIRRRREAGR